MILKLNFKNMLKPIIRLTAIVLFVFIANYVYVGKFDKGDVELLIVIFSILVLPTIYLFIEYFIATRNQTVEITENYIHISYNNGKDIHYLIQDLKILKLYKSKGMEKGSFPYQTAEMFYHAKIYTTDGTKIILTSFLGPNFDEALNELVGVDKKVYRRMYSTIYIPSLF